MKPFFSSKEYWEGFIAALLFIFFALVLWVA